ncbi:MAG: SGNH/GDSL hydrolase family protein [Clostridia bacterium]|nr:SGNH/GDSL hydrolase family protein [Clostridia bacterium]
MIDTVKRSGAEAVQGKRRKIFTSLTAMLLAIVMLFTLLFAGCAVEPKKPDAEKTPDNIVTEAPEVPTNEPKEELDMKNFPFYVDPAGAVYDFGEKGKGKVWNNAPVYQPYWLGNIIYQETVLCIDDGSEISGMLQYKPVKIISVRDDTYTTEYAEGTDYTVTGNKIVLPEGSSCPYLTKENLNGVNIPKKYRAVKSLSEVSNTETDYMMWTENIFFTEGSLIHGHQICVSYVYDINDVDTSILAEYGSVAPKFLAKLQAGEKTVISITGDSVAEGCSASSKLSRQPLMPQFPTLLTYALNAAYEGKATIKNYAVGGTTSNEAVSTNVAAKLVKANSDLVLIHFGINDSGGLSAAQLKANIKKVVDATLAELPECEFLYIKCFPANPVLYPDAKFKSYWKAVDELAEEYDCFYTLDLYTPGLKMLETKKYLDVTGNGINHPNDYIVRFYAMNLINLFVDYKEK